MTLFSVTREGLLRLESLWNGFRAPLKIGFRRLFSFEQSPIGKIFGGYVQVATLKSSCIGFFAHPLKIHPIEFLEIPFQKCQAEKNDIRHNKAFFRNVI